jgi:NADH dehydrogenase FAD-containing subunit
MTGGRPLAVDEQLRLIGHERVFGLGDCIAKPPPTAQNAKRQGEYLATLFNARFRKDNGYTFQEMGRVLDMNNGLLIEVFGRVFFLVVPDFDEWKMLMSL